MNWNSEQRSSLRMMGAGLLRKQSIEEKAMRKSGYVILAGMLMFACTVADAAEISAEKRAAIDEMLTITGAKKLAPMMADSMVDASIEMARQQDPGLSEQALQVIREETSRIIKEEMFDNDSFAPRFYPLYDKYFTEAELREMLDFYSTPIGKKVIEVMPALMQDSIKIGQEWAASFMPRLQGRLEKRMKELSAERNPKQ